MWVVYRITNTINNKTYVGQTNNLNLRIVKHKHRAKSSELRLYKEIREYDWNVFKFDILEGNISSRELALEREKLWIKILTPEYNYKQSEINKKISEIQTGENNPMFGRKGLNNPKSKTVLCIETKQAYNSTKECGSSLGIRPERVAICCRNGQKANGYTFKYII